MVSMSQSVILYRLQQIDSQLDESRSRWAAIETSLKDDAILRQADQNAHEAEAAFQTSQKALHRAEMAVHDQRIKIEQTEAALYGGKVRNPKELQDLQKDAASLKKYILVLEDNQLEAMMALEETETAHKNAQAALLETIAHLAEHNSGLKGELTNIQKAIERLEVERQATLSAISPEILSLYEQLRQQRRGIAVARLQDKSCAACGSTLTPAMAQTAHTSQQLIRCPSCGRILYAG